MVDPMRVGVFGAGGRMGSTVCAAVAGDPDLELVAAVDPYRAGIDLRQATGLDTTLQISPGPEALLDARAEVAVDFTVLDEARRNLEWCADHGVHAVVGTTGFDSGDFGRLESIFTRSNCLVAPNFAIGAVLMMKFAEMAAPWFETGEIVELHHDGKVDAPSGTAMATAQRMLAASEEWAGDPTRHVAAEGARGASVGQIHVHAVRLRGLMAHQEVLLGTTGQTLTIRHDSIDRSSFMPGVLLACKEIANYPGLTVGLEAFLEV